jgi:drug/metabolite transporter, DME family
MQMALPYVLFARSLSHVSPTEAAIITLIEPLLNPVWAYLLSPETDVPTWWTILGGSVLLAALVWRYWPKRQVKRA